MSANKNTRTAADYRDEFFHRIPAFSRTRDVSVWRMGCVTGALLFMIACSSISTGKSKTMEQGLDNFKSMVMALIPLFLYWTECWCCKPLGRLFNYITAFQAKSRYGLVGEEEIMKTACDRARKEIKYYSTLFLSNLPVILSGKALTGGISGGSWRQFPLSWTIPTDDDIVFTAVFLCQAALIILCHFIGAVAICAVSSLPTQIYGMFEVVILGIERIEERAQRKMETLGLTKEESMLLCIKESISDHQELVTEIVSIKDYFEMMYGSNFYFIGLLMACEALPLLKDDVTVVIAFKGVVFLIIQVLCAFIVADRLEMIADQNVLLFEAMSTIPWYEHGTEFRTVLLNGLTFSHKPLKFNVWHLTGMKASREQFYNVVINSINVLNLIRNIM